MISFIDSPFHFANKRFHFMLKDNIGVRFKWCRYHNFCLIQEVWSKRFQGSDNLFIQNHQKMIAQLLSKYDITHKRFCEVCHSETKLLRLVRVDFLNRFIFYLETKPKAFHRKLITWCNILFDCNNFSCNFCEQCRHRDLCFFSSSWCFTESNISREGSEYIEGTIDNNHNIQNTNKHHIIKFNINDRNHTERYLPTITLHHPLVTFIRQQR